MQKQTNAALATVFGLATAGVGTGYGFLINGIDHSHEQEALRQNPFVFLLPTWPSALIALLILSLFALTVVFTLRAAWSSSAIESTSSSEPDSGVAPATTLSPAPSGRVITSHLWRDHDGMRAYRRIDGRLRVVWATNGALAGWLRPDAVGGWDAMNVDHETIASVSTEEEGMRRIRDYLLEENGN